MSEHFTKNTTEAPAWCNSCRRFTQHKVSAGRLAHCIDPDHARRPELTKAQSRRRELADKARREPGLFE